MDLGTSEAEECAKFRGSYVIMGLKFFLMAISWVQFFFRGYFMSLKFFLVDILQVRKKFRWFKIFSGGYSVGNSSTYKWGISITKCHNFSKGYA